MPWTTVRVDREVNEKLKALAEKEGVSVREFLRRLIERMETKEEKRGREKGITATLKEELERHAQRELSPEEWELSECYWEIVRGFERWRAELDKIKAIREKAIAENAHPSFIAKLDSMIAIFEDQQRKIQSTDDFVIYLADFLHRKLGAPMAAERLAKLWERCKEWRGKLL